MKLYTSLALSIIAAISGFLAFETKAMEERVRSKDESIVWIVNNSSSSNLEIELKTTVAAGGNTINNRIELNGGKRPLGKAGNIASISFKTYGDYAGMFSKFQPLDFKTPLKEGKDIAFVFSAGETQAPTEAMPSIEGTPSTATAPGMLSSLGSYFGYELPSIPETGISSYIPSGATISSYLPSSVSEAFSAWAIKVEYLNPGDQPMAKPGVEGQTKEKGPMPSTGLWSVFSTEVQEAQLLADAQQLKVYRLMLKLKPKYSLGELNFGLDGAKALLANNQNALRIIRVAYEALLANLKSEEQQQ